MSDRKLKAVPPARPKTEALPFDGDIERLVIGNVLLDPDPHLIDQLTDDLFVLDKHRLICQAARKLRTVITATTVAAQLDKDGYLEQVEGLPGIVACTDGVHRVSNWQGYVDLLRGFADLRWLAVAAGTARDASLERGINFLDIATEFKDSLTRRIHAASKTLDGREMIDVTERETEWLVDQLIPIGSLTLWDGDGGGGKSTAALALAVGIAQGYGFPHQQGTIENPHKPGTVLIFQSEDSLEETVKRRLRLLNHDGKNIHVITDRGLRFFDTRSFARFEVTIEKFKPRLVIIDPFFQYVSRKVNTGLPNEIREITGELARIAEDHHLGMLIIRHQNKGDSVKPGKRGLGSQDIPNGVRSACIVGFDVDDENRRAIIHWKSNLGPKLKPIGYHIDREGRLTWTGESDVTPTQILSDPKPEDSQTTHAKRFIVQFLAKGPRLASDVVDTAAEHGIAKSSLYIAKNALGSAIQIEDADLPRGKGRPKVYWRYVYKGDAGLNTGPLE